MINFDNASTTFPKPASVPEAMLYYMTEIGSNISRASYAPAYTAGETVYETRELLCDMFEGPDPANVVFTANITESLNILLKGFLHPRDHVIVSSYEHNSVMRPLTQLIQKDISFSVLNCSDKTIKPDEVLNELENLIRPNTSLIIVTHASNVCGSILPIKEIGEFCSKHNIAFFVDTAQTAGLLPISMKECRIDALAFTGHKALYGPQGIGGFILTDNMAAKIEPLISGGTGSKSHLAAVPDFMPDRFEAGTANIPGIYGLNAALKWINETGMQNMLAHEQELTAHFITGINAIDPEEKLIHIHGISNPADFDKRVGVVSITVEGWDPSELALMLEEKYQILTRVGLHCSPEAHRTLGTYPEGTVRFSFGYFNTTEEIDILLNALGEISRAV